MTAPAPSPAEQAVIDRFEAAPAAPESFDPIAVVRRVEALVRAEHPRMIAAHEVRDALHGSRRGHGASEGDPSL